MSLLKFVPLSLVCLAFSSIIQAQTLNFRAAADYSAANKGDAVLVMQNGKIVFQEFQNGYDSTQPHALASGTKSFSCAFAVAAQDDGLINLDEPVANTITTWKLTATNPAPQVNFKSQITARQLLSLSAGLSTDYPDMGQASNFDSYKLAVNNRSAYAPNQALIYTPGSFQAFAVMFALKTGGVLTTSGPDAGSVVGGQDPVDYLTRKVFNPIGLKLDYWGRDILGRPNMGGGARMQPQEWAKFGQLMLQGGMWNGVQILNASRLRECTTYNNPTFAGYGLSFWLNRPLGNTYNPSIDIIPAGATGIDVTSNQSTPAAPSDVYLAAGAGYQRLFVIPSLNLVVVRFATNGNWSDNEFLKRLLGTTTVKAQPFNYQDLWWAGADENGWGFTINQQGEALFNVFYVYDSAGKPQWVVMSGGTWNDTYTTFTGALYIPTGSPFSGYDATKFNVGASVGTAILSFRDASSATLSYTINGVPGTKAISRLVFANGNPQNNYSDIWWGGQSQNGWGFSMTQQGSVIFGVWYTYDAQGKVTWYYMPGGSFTSTNIFSGALYRTTSSPWLGTVYNPATINVTPVGNVTLTFNDSNNAVMRWSVDGLSGSNSIARLVFGTGLPTSP